MEGHTHPTERILTFRKPAISSKDMYNEYRSRNEHPRCKACCCVAELVGVTKC